jgi:hypothetical protein
VLVFVLVRLDCIGAFKDGREIFVIGNSRIHCGGGVHGWGGPSLIRSVVHGFGWEIGREVVHGVVHHVLR